jgi:hypothetical protein
MTDAKPLEQAVCARCGAAIDPSDHFLVRAIDADGAAFLCRSEHIVAWVMRGAQWQFERPWEVDADDRSATGAVKVERVRSGAVIERDFESAERLRAWASAGAFWSSE